ncbi:MAG: helix-turn-helix transcriptional regulator [Ktedonobacteraceae bacterium]|nr:helix-turn-helix transcriptional regulator [Ktedonobacteraceae bacterium]
MLDYTRYETPAATHRQLGLLCTGVGGFTHKTVTCPPRRLSCYAAVWISNGTGWLETSATPQRIQIVSGTLFWLFPGVTHTYAPDAGGWTEQWTLFEGPLMASFERLDFLSPAQPAQFVGNSGAIETIFAQLYTDFQESGPLTGVLSASLIHRLIIVVHQLAIEMQTEHDPVARAVQSSRAWLDEHAFEVCSLEELAADCNMGYSTFRRHFKSLVGCSPKEYILRLRLRRAKELLAFTQQNVVEIARHVGFADSFYFSRLFHEKEGISPSLFRVQQRLALGGGGFQGSEH